MKRILFLMMGFAIVTTVKAQEIPERKIEKPGMHDEMNRGRHDRGMKDRHDRMKMMAKDLNLTEQQKDQLKKNREEMQSKMKAIREDQWLSNEKKRDAIKEEIKVQKEKNKSILTEDQKKKMKGMHDKKDDFKGRKPADRKVV